MKSLNTVTDTGSLNCGKCQASQGSHSRAGARWLMPLMGILLLSSTGCSSLWGGHDLAAIPVNRVPLEYLEPDQYKDDLEEISLQRLRQDPPSVYQLGPGDILGIYIENVIGSSEELPPVNYPDDSSLPPSIGFPVPVREDGTIAVPLVPPIEVHGMTLVQATAQIRESYTKTKEILKEGEDRIIVTLMRRRTIRVFVIREESGGIADVTKRGTGQVLDLPIYENDVLHALSETGGMPGTDAKNEVLIYRGMYDEALQYERNMVRADQLYQDACHCDQTEKPDPPNMLRIPLRFDPNYPPQFQQNDIILRDNDIVMIRSRESEVFYTGGVLGGGELPLPRDRDIDIFAAIALAGGPLGSGNRTGLSAGQGGGFGGGGGGGGGQCGPSELIIIRELPCDQQITMKVDLNQAMQDRTQRVTIQPNDMLILRYSLREEITNFSLGIVQFQLFRSAFN